MSTIYHPKRAKMWWYKWYENGKFHRKSLGTRDKALAKYLQSKEDIMRTEHKRPTMNPEAEYILHEYDLSVQKRKAKDTHYRDMRNIELFLKTMMIQKISDITEKTLQDYFNKRRGDGIAPSTVNRNMASIKTFLRFALRRRYIFVDPFVEIKKYPIPERLPRFFKAKDEIAKLLEVAKQTHLYPVVATAVYTGMRQAELFSLDWTDINFETNTITVQNTERHTTKSKKIRVIPIHPALKAILKPLAQEKGHCFDTTNHKRVFRRIMKACGMPSDWRILRHTFASHLVMEGVDLPTVKDLLGHANISTTMIYSHLAPAHAKKSLEKLNF